jgi:general secretion pathway protein C
MRFGLPLTAALIVAFAVCYGGSDWYAAVLQWLHPSQRTSTPERWHAQAGAQRSPITVTPPRPLGTDSSVSLTPQKLILVSAEPGRNSKEGLARIGTNPLSPQTYQTGAILANGARLVEVHEDYVVLERGGQRLRLSANNGSVISGSSASLASVGGAGMKLPGPSAADPIAKYVATTPLYVGSRLRGLALRPGSEVGPFAKWGLESGDVLTEVNGTRLLNPSQGAAGLRSLLQGSSLTVEIERQGVVQTLVLDGSIVVPRKTPSGPAVHVEGLTPPDASATL